ncbi:hypothetical protein DERF_011092 [Dermatophagoides farinae]|uniref:Spermidine synthase-like protein n=1 Tax=Dermatophagoides farinae TaxID=6954 RepID=A0A922HU99_DERFA|nr:spermidine synthase-like [Dermatophagoides farinae]KAH7643516.1 spermidine synthase-like protein [Dermatophagoides farinae]KAH9506354.1 hypothetical protein DERF_011092 [Dermatophagoides farinae]
MANNEQCKNHDNEDWFVETGVLNSDQCRLTIKIGRKLIEKQSKYQNILAFENEKFGRCLVLDDAIQCTELDECSYQEMISFLPLNIHPNPERVLIIGGGDGGVAREVAKHPLVKHVVQCEIDSEVVEISKKYLPFMGVGFENEKLKLFFQDGYEYVRNHKNEFDVIITDSSDPKGPATTLYQSEYYQALYECLRHDGIICCQAESYWFDLEFIKNLFHKVQQIFPSLAYASTAVASYPSGQIGFLIASKSKTVDFKHAKHQEKFQKIAEKLRYYSPEMHSSAFILPMFVQRQLDQVLNNP